MKCPKCNRSMELDIVELNSKLNLVFYYVCPNDCCISRSEIKATDNKSKMEFDFKNAKTTTYRNS